MTNVECRSSIYFEIHNWIFNIEHFTESINDITFFMAQLNSSNITIAGTPIKQITSFQLTQNIFDHHYFRLVCPAESLEGLEGGMLQSSRNLIV